MTSPRSTALLVLVLFEAAAAGQAPPAADWSALDARAAALYDAGNVTGAVDEARRALSAAGSPAQTGRSLDRLGFYIYISGDLPEGEKLLRQALELRERSFGADSPEYAETANDLAMLLRDVRKLDEAAGLAQQSVSTRERVFGIRDLRFAESLNTLGTVYGLGGDYAKAVSQFERALAIHEERPAAERATEEYGTLCVNLAGTYQRLGKYASAEATFAKGLDALRIKPGVKHPAYAASLMAFASLEVDLGRYTEAERFYEEGGQLFASELGVEHPLYAAFLNNRGYMYQSIGNAPAAEADYRHSLDLKKKLYGPASPLALSTLRNLAHLTYLRNHEAGEQLLAEAVETYAKAANPPPFDYASVLLGLGRARRDRGALDAARAVVEQARTVAERGLGTGHPLYADAVRDLGTIEAAAGDADAAERDFQEAVAIAEQAHGSSHPDVVAFLAPLARLYVAQHKDAAALPLYRRMFDLQDRFLDVVLEIGSERAKTEAMAAAADLAPALIAFQAQAGDALPAARALAFEAVTQRKGRVLEQVRDWRQRLRATGSAAVRRELAEWQALLECRTSLTLALGYRELKPGVVGGCTLEGTELEGRYERLLSDLRARWSRDLGTQAVRAIADLSARGESLEAALNREAGGAHALRRASLDDIRARLRRDELLIEFVAYADAGTDARRYGAFVVGAAGRVGWTDIGPAPPIDRAVRDLLAAANDWSVSVRNHEEQPERASAQTARDAVSRLSTMVWRPLKPIVDAAPAVRQLRIAPDAMLNLVPFDALDGGGELIDKFAIGYLPAGRDLADEAESGASTSVPVVLVSPGSTRRAARVAAPAPASTARTFRADGLAALPSAALEAADFRRVFPRAALYASAEATEHRVKTLHGPPLLHIVGHGIVGGDEDCRDRGCLTSQFDLPSRAMTLSAIVLEEAYGRGGASADDGMLTALELENVDLRGTEMLVLSQCEMASGSASTGEGVYGMRRAAAIAGARTFVAPLWNIEDRVQRGLMDRFYGALASGASRAEALRRAKLALRAAPGTHDFLYWAPVILSGSASPLPPALFKR
jgi:CHAT domain-containing protein/tetratricopeptide (TPR) repeat protein